MGKRVSDLVQECTPFEGYFAENQTTLKALSENVLRRLYDSVGLIVIMHHRGTVEMLDRKVVRASVWIEQEIAIATLMEQILRRPLHAALFVQRGVAIEGIRQQLQLNGIEFATGDEVIARLRGILPTWTTPLYIGDEELRKMADSVDLSIHVAYGHYSNVTIEVENHSKIDVVVISIVLWSQGSRLCTPVFPPEGVIWSVPGQRRLPIEFTAKENVALRLANIYEQPPPVGNFPRTFRAELGVKLRCEINGVEREFEEKSIVQVDLRDRQITGL